MSFEVIHDAEKDVAALVDAEFGRALGPIASGEKAVELLEKFAGAHGVDPATIPTGELESRWKDFVSALTGEVEDAAGEIHRVADEVLHPAHAGAPAEAAPGTVIEPPANPVADPVIDPSAAPEKVEPATAAQEAPSPEGERVMPVTSAKPGYAICPTCDGWGEIAAEGGVATCPTCKGQGEVPAHEDAAAQHPAA